MESHARTNPAATTTSLGLCLLPSELIHNILLNLTVPDIKSLGRVNKCLFSVISDHSFLQDFNTRSGYTSWLFFGKKRWPQDATLHGFTPGAGSHWFMIPIAKLLKPAIFPSEDLYFLTANGNIFLFASNTQRSLIAADMVNKRVIKIPTSPLGPRGTSSWRRYGMKLVSHGPAGSGHFRFLFSEVVGNIPTLFVYCSESNLWQSMKADENPNNYYFGYEHHNGFQFLNLIYRPHQNILIVVGASRPIILRPRFPDGIMAQVTTGHGCLQVYGDGYMVIARSESESEDSHANRGVRMLGSLELWGLSLDGSQWKLVSKVPGEMMAKLRKPYAVLMGCLEVRPRDGTVSAALVSTLEGQWDILWMSYIVRDRVWAYNPVPDCRMNCSNMAGISFSSGLTLS